MRRVLAISSVVLWLSSSTARANQAAPLVPVMDPPKAAELLTQFHDALGQGLRAGGLQVMDPSAVRSRLQQDIESAGCFEGSCLANAQRLFQTHILATAQIKSVGKNYTIEVRLFSNGSVYAQGEGRCDICTVAEALEATTKAATEAAHKGGAPPPLPAAPTPLPKAAPPKPVPPAQPRAPRPVTPAPAAPPVTPAPASQPAEPEAETWPLWPGIALAGTGVLFLGIGIPVLAMDGDGTNCVGEPLPDYGNCADLYETSAGGWLLTGGGLAALAASGVMFYLHFASRPSERATVGVSQFLISPTSAGGVVLGASGSF